MSIMWNGGAIQKIMYNGREVQAVMYNGAQVLPGGIPANGELVVNGDFTNGGNGWIIESGTWAFLTGAAVCTSASWSGLLRQWIRVAENTDYTLKIGTNEGNIGVGAWENMWGNFISDPIPPQTTTGTFSMTTPAACSYILIEIANGTNDNKPAFDNISLQKAQLQSSYTLTYTAGPNGTITGTSPQTVVSGGGGTQVTAIANSGYHFVNWSDGLTTASRTDTNVLRNLNVTANFAMDGEAPELVTNGDFSNGSNGWIIENGTWEFSTGAAVCTSASWSGLLRQWIPVTGNTSYTLAIGTNEGNIGVGAWENMWGNFISDPIPPQTTSGKFIFTTPAACSYILLEIANGMNDSKPAFDSISIKKTV